MKKTCFCKCKNKAADQIRSNCAIAVTAKLICGFVFAFAKAGDQRLCFHCIDSTNSATCSIQNFRSLSFLCACTARFVSDLVGKLEDRFSKDAAHIWPAHKIMTEEKKRSIFEDNNRE